MRAADVAIIVAGLDLSDEGEGHVAAGDRESLELIHAVAAIHDRVIVALEGGGPLTRSWESEVEAILFAFYPGTRGGDAIAEIVFGDFAPSGRLRAELHDVSILEPGRRDHHARGVGSRVLGRDRVRVRGRGDRLRAAGLSPLGRPAAHREEADRDHDGR